MKATDLLEPSDKLKGHLTRTSVRGPTHITWASTCVPSHITRTSARVPSQSTRTSGRVWGQVTGISSTVLEQITRTSYSGPVPGQVTSSCSGSSHTYLKILARLRVKSHGHLVTLGVKSLLYMTSVTASSYFARKHPTGRKRSVKTDWLELKQM